MVLQPRPVANLGPRVVPQCRATPNARNFGQNLRLVSRPALRHVVAADVTFQHHQHAGADVPVVHLLPVRRFGLVVPQPSLALAVLQHLLDADERDGTALLGRLQQGTIEIIAAWWDIAGPVAPEHGDVEVGIRAANERAHIGEAAVDVTLGREQSVDIERARQRTLRWLERFADLLRALVGQLMDGVRERVLL